MTPAALRSDLVEAAHVLSGLGLVTAYGHVSARSEASMLITPAADLAIVTESTIVTMPLDTASRPAGAPAEAWIHLALYHARPDADSIARAQPPAAFAAAATTTALAPLHGQATWLGESVPVHDSARLKQPDLFLVAAGALGDQRPVLLLSLQAEVLQETLGHRQVRYFQGVVVQS